MQSVEKYDSLLESMDYREIAKIFKALADDTRLKIMQFLIDEGRHCVMEIAEALEISQTASSRNLKMLREAGFLRDERVNPCIFYEISPEYIEIIDFLTQQFKERI